MTETATKKEIKLNIQSAYSSFPYIQISSVSLFLNGCTIRKADAINFHFRSGFVWVSRLFQKLKNVEIT